MIYRKFKNETKNKEKKIQNTNIREEIIIPSKKEKAKKKRKKKTKSNTNSNATKNLFFNKNLDMNNKKSEIPQIKPDTDYELNWLSYKDALKFDKRTSCEYYGSLIRTKQLFIFTFCSFNDYNSGVIKKFIMFLSFALHYTVNALFFNDSNMHQIYEDEGIYFWISITLYHLFSDYFYCFFKINVTIFGFN